MARRPKRTRSKTLTGIKDLAPAPYNPRRISGRAAQGLTASLDEFGDMSGIVWNARSRHLIAGHQRLKSLKAQHRRNLEFDHVAPAIITPGGERFPIRVVDWPPSKEKAANLAANSPLLAGEFISGVEDIIKDIVGDMPDLANALRFPELDIPLGQIEPKPGLTDPDAVPNPPKKPISKRGDVWVLGEHRLLCGDSTNMDDVKRLMGGEQPSLIFADPPYGMRLNTDYTKMPERSIKSKSYAAVYGDDSDFDPRLILNQFSDVTEQLWWGGDYYYTRLPPGGSWIVWDKRNDASAGVIGNHFEVCWSKNPHRRIVLRHHWVGFTAHDKGEHRTHPTQKPAELTVTIMDGVPGDLVLDPYVGSGTTIIAAEQLGRKCYAIEIEPRYVDVAVRRWEDFTGKKAKLMHKGKKNK